MVANTRRVAGVVRSYDVVEQPGTQGQPGTKKLGLVWRVAGESDSEDDMSLSSEEASDDEVPENKAQVAWLDEARGPRDRGISADDVHVDLEDVGALRVVDRQLVLGEVVASADDPLGQTGVVVGVRREIDVRLSTGAVRTNVPTDVLEPVLRFQPDQYVLHSGWLGRIDFVEEAVTVRFVDGVVAELRGVSESGLLLPQHEHDHLFREEYSCPYYPGQLVKFKSYSALHSARVRVLSGGAAVRALRGTVLAVAADELGVEWQAPATAHPESGPPPDNVHPGECTQLTYHYFGPCYWHLGMRGLWRGDAAPGPASPTAAALEGTNPSPPQTHMRRQRSAGARRRGVGAAHPAPAPGAASGGAPPAAAAHAGAAAEAGRAAGDAPACDPKRPAGEEQQSTVEAAAGQEPAPDPLERAPGSVEEPMAEVEPGSGSEDGDADEASSPAPEPEPSTCSGGVLSAVAAAVFSAMGSLGRGATAPAAAAAAPAAAAGDNARPLPQPPAGLSGGGEAGGGPAPRPAEGHCRARGPGGSFRRRPRKRRGGAAAAGAGAPEPAVTAQVLATRTTVDVHWQDGRQARGAPAAAHGPCEHLDDPDFWPDDFVEEKPAVDDLDEDGAAPRPLPRTGVVLRVNAAARTAVVAWLGQAADGSLQPLEPAEAGETVSVYSIVAHPDFSFQIADVVLHLERASAAAATAALAAVATFRTETAAGREAAGEGGARGAAPSSDRRLRPGHPDRAGSGGSGIPSAARRAADGVALATFTECTAAVVGEVVALRGGRLLVRWADGSETLLGPDKVFMLSREDDEPPGDEGEPGDEGGHTPQHARGPADAPPAGLGRWLQRRHASRGAGAEDGGGSDAGSGWRTASDSSADSDAAADMDTSEGPAAAAAASARSAAKSGAKPGGRAAAKQGGAREGAPQARGAEAGGEAQGRSGSAAAANTEGTAEPSDSPTAMDESSPEVASKQAPAGGDPPASAERRGAHAREGAPEGRAPAPELAAGASPETPANGGATPAIGGAGVPADAADAGARRSADEGDGARGASGAGSSRAAGGKAGAGADPDPSPGAGPQAVAPLADAAAFVAACPHFDVVEGEPEGHAHLGAPHPAGAASARRFQKAVLREWATLRANLPTSIWVRAYESRMDLLRAAVAGAAGTPYHDQLFFFDIQLPPDYPGAPPLVQYHSWGMRANPNLYECGKVCLSLLNTWAGRNSEVWDASCSTLLQVLVSIQGLVLVPKPYFNEAGYERQVGSSEGERNSLLYNESCFLVVCRSALHVLRRTPAPFGPLARAYYKVHGGALLRACRAYASGAARVGQELAPAPSDAQVAAVAPAAAPAAASALDAAPGAEAVPAGPCEAAREAHAPEHAPAHAPCPAGAPPSAPGGAAPCASPVEAGAGAAALGSGAAGGKGGGGATEAGGAGPGDAGPGDGPAGLGSAAEEPLTSEGFRLVLRQVLPRLEAALGAL